VAGEKTMWYTGSSIGRGEEMLGGNAEGRCVLHACRRHSRWSKVVSVKVENICCEHRRMNIRCHAMSAEMHAPE